jgi:hypothetical protein
LTKQYAPINHDNDIDEGNDSIEYRTQFLETYFNNNAFFPVIKECIYLCDISKESVATNEANSVAAIEGKRKEFNNGNRPDESRSYKQL